MKIMKRISAVLLLSLLLTACQTVPQDASSLPSEPQPSASEPSTETTTPEVTLPAEVTEPLPTVPSEEELLAQRVPLSEDLYTWQVTQTPPTDGRGWGTQARVSALAFRSKDDLAKKLSNDLYDFTYTDAACPISSIELASRYDDAFFQDSVLVLIEVLSHNEGLPEIERIDMGDHYFGIFELHDVQIYVKNTDLNSGQDKKFYLIFLELPVSIAGSEDVIWDWEYIGAWDDGFYSRDNFT